jgi:copper(I)-binding protein
VEVRDAWLRSTVPGQPTTGLYARLAAPSGARLVGMSTPIGEASVHEMKMDGDVMRMRELPDGLDVPPGRAVELAPSGYHVMVTGLKQPLAVGTVVPVALHFVDRDGRKGDVTLQVPVQAAPPSSPEDHRHAH